MAGAIPNHAQHGDPLVQEFLRRLLQRVWPPLYEMVRSWLLVGGITEAAKASMRQEISITELINVEQFVRTVMILVEHRKRLHEYLAKKMNDRMTNSASLIGEIVGAYLICHASSLPNFVRCTPLTPHVRIFNQSNTSVLTTLMHAGRHGHWEVRHTLLLFKSNVTQADYLSGRTSLYFAAVNGHVRCVRLVVADFVPSECYEITSAQTNNGDRDNGSILKNKYGQCALSKFVNIAGDGAKTALHRAALNGYFDCVQLLLDIQANILAVVF
ncbi:hypothetical protein IFM89_009190 [Coptis chinensis]|uniref:Nop domain-containing protein n=1 Tax=Coptis chinensis TaxID=261450 RepID=A0A835IX77_9MAGN|nr:hypothetical protein IFM89_009190 [Coptis chinensis]